MLAKIPRDTWLAVAVSGQNPCKHPSCWPLNSCSQLVGCRKRSSAAAEAWDKNLLFEDFFQLIESFSHGPGAAPGLLVQSSFDVSGSSNTAIPGRRDSTFFS